MLGMILLAGLSHAVDLAADSSMDFFFFFLLPSRAIVGFAFHGILTWMASTSSFLLALNF